MPARRTGDLDEYNAKRDFALTDEPAGKASGKKDKGGGSRFVVQKHAARRLHYDFRLELDGVLKSWAVTRGPSLDPAEKRLAVRTEDHPLDYGGFEGVIPKGQYGGGTVMLWDRGTWTPEDDPHEGLKQGKLGFTLDGERMKGSWTLVRMRGKPREKRENWLLIKHEDEVASTSEDLTPDDARSVATGRTMAEIAEGAPARKKKTGRPAAKKSAASSARRRGSTRRPGFRKPQLATLTDTVPDGRAWLHEVKYDGYRCLVATGGDGPVCYTRNGHDWTDRFAALAVPLAKLDLPPALIDGEVVALDADGHPDFSRLQRALKEGGPLAYFAFDLLVRDGEDLTGLPLVERKQALQDLLKGLPKGAPVHYSEHVRGEGEHVLSALCAQGFEGVVSKRADAPYRSGRGRAWLKIKCSARQEFVIGGWTPSKRRVGFRSLLLGYYRDGALVYAGRVGTGFDSDLLESLSARLERIETEKCPFESVPRAVARDARWVRPRLVAEIAFSEFTHDGHLRHPSFLGLRGDKKAADVVREAAVADAVTPDAADVAETAPPAAAKSGKRKAGKRKAGGKAPDKGDQDVDGECEIRGIRITSTDRVLFPSMGLTKLDLIRYFEAVEPLLMPHLANRPVSFVRCPQGRQRKCFFQRHDSGGFPEQVKHVPVKRSSGEVEDYLYVDRLEGVIAAVQMGVLEFHIWGARVDRLERPDRLVFDLDPDEALRFADVKSAAVEVRDFLAELGLTTYPMVTGGKGVHVVAPLVRRAEWPTVKGFARAVAEALAAAAPQRYVANMSKARRKGRIFVDYLRNDRTATAIAPYSTRARDGAPVALPVGWDELAGLKSAAAFDVAGMIGRSDKDFADPWQGYGDVRQSISEAMLDRLTSA